MAACGVYRAAGQAAFTMVEIALALAVIAFALVAIIGILPSGMNVQKENREETIINQDAMLFIEAIRSGARGLDDLANYVVAITNHWAEYGPNAGFVQAGYDGYTYQGSRVTSWFGSSFPLTNGYRIIGLLSTPRYTPSPTPGNFYSNQVVALVRAMSGSVADKYPQRNETILGGAFSYRLVLDVVPYVPPPSTNVLAGLLRTNLHELRLSFRWPLLPNNNTGFGRQTFRTRIGGQLVKQPRGPLYFFEPDTYALPPQL